MRDRIQVLHGQSQTRLKFNMTNPLSPPLYHSPSTLSAVGHLSVTVCRLGQIISETPAPCFRVFVQMSSAIILYHLKSQHHLRHTSGKNDYIRTLRTDFVRSSKSATHTCCFDTKSSSIIMPTHDENNTLIFKNSNFSYPF